MNNAPARFGRYCFKIWLPVLSILAFLVAAEFVCRVFELAPPKEEFRFASRRVDGPNETPANWVVALENDVNHPYVVEDWLLLWTLKPDYVDDEYRINSAGFRDREYSIEKADDVFRILSLGDSTTFGYGVRPSETYHALLEEALNRNAERGGLRYEVINGGVTGYSSAQCLALYKVKGCKYRPDLVTLCVGINDMKSTNSYIDEELMEARAESLKRTARRVDSLLEDLDSYRTYRRLVRRAAGLNADRGEARPRVSVDHLKSNIVELNRLCAENGATLVLIQFTRRKQMPLEHNLPSYRRAIDEVGGEQGIPVLTIVEMTENAASVNAELFHDSNHPNPAGHALIAQRLRAFLVSGGLLARK